jgi:hypothetical protein
LIDGSTAAGRSAIGSEYLVLGGLAVGLQPPVGCNNSIVMLRRVRIRESDRPVDRAGSPGVGLSDFRCKRVCHCQLLLRSIRPSKVIANAFSAAFQRVTQRARPLPLGSKLLIVRYKHFTAASSFPHHSRRSMF